MVLVLVLCLKRLFRTESGEVAIWCGYLFTSPFSFPHLVVSVSYWLLIYCTFLIFAPCGVSVLILYEKNRESRINEKFDIVKLAAIIYRD
jgi:hypothetical protein